MKIQIRFDAPPGPDGIAGRFIEVEDEFGRGINAGVWRRDGKDWLLVIDTDRLELSPPPTEAEMALVGKIIRNIAEEDKGS